VISDIHFFHIFTIKIVTKTSHTYIYILSTRKRNIESYLQHAIDPNQEVTSRKFQHIYKVKYYHTQTKQDKREIKWTEDNRKGKKEENGVITLKLSIHNQPTASVQ